MKKTPKRQRTRKIKMTYRTGVDIAWHFEDGEIVIDKYNIPISSELVDIICPPWVRDVLTKKPKP